MDEKNCCADLLKFRDELLLLRRQIEDRRRKLWLNYDRGFLFQHEMIQYLDNLIQEIVGNDFTGKSGGV